MKSDAEFILKLREESWCKLIKDNRYLYKLKKIIDRKEIEHTENNFISKDYEIELYAFFTMFKELRIRRAKYIGEDISHNKDIIWMQDELPESWKILDKNLDVLQRIIDEKNKKRIRGGFLGKDFEVEFTLLSIACAELHLRKSEKLKEPIGIKL